MGIQVHKNTESRLPPMIGDRGKRKKIELAILPNGNQEGDFGTMGRSLYNHINLINIIYYLILKFNMTLA